MARRATGIVELYFSCWRFSAKEFTRARFSAALPAVSLRLEIIRSAGIKATRSYGRIVLGILAGQISDRNCETEVNDTECMPGDSRIRGS